MIRSVAIVTRDRPVDLERNLRALVPQLAKRESTTTVFVVDSSREAATCSLNQEVLAKLTSDVDQVEFRYVGHEEVRKITACIGEKLPEAKDIIDFLFKGSPDLGVATGASRNLHLLFSRGHETLALDDDIIPNVYVRKHKEFTDEALSVPAISTFYCDERDVLDDLTPCPDIDVLGVHERLLGLRHVNTYVAKKVASGDQTVTGGHIIATVSGVAGSATSDSPIAGFFGALSLRSYRARKRQDYYRFLEGGHTIRAAASDRAARGFLTSGYCLGLRNDGELPPWFPNLRAQDLIFGNALKVLRPMDSIGYSSFSVIHKRATPHRFSRPEIWKRHARATAGEIVANIVSRFEPDLAKSLDRSQQLGLHLSGLANLGERNFRDVCCEAVLDILMARIRRLNIIYLATFDEPVFVQRDVSNLVAEISSSIRNKKSMGPYDLDGVVEKPYELFASLIREYGKGFLFWKRIMDLDIPNTIGFNSETGRR